jgi:hypothetical protein
LYDPKYVGNITAAEVKTFAGLERIYILLGSEKGACDLTTRPLTEVPPLKGQPFVWSKTSRAVRYAQLLRQELEKTSNAWKAYQRRRLKQGKSSPDWVVPSVVVACLKPICEVLSPYSY